MAALIRAQSRFLQRRTLIVTGERAQESRARAGYAVFEPDRTDTRDGTWRQRHVDHWRAVHQLDEQAFDPGGHLQTVGSALGWQPNQIGSYRPKPVAVELRR
jgi:3'-phosphoadenosine 5'-phosphosulfate sulfotransferase (PAPS reductase)/FAD synthetase